MKKGIIINFKRFKLLNYVNFNKVLLGLCFVFLLGVFIGVYYFTKSEFLFNVSELLFNDYLIHKTKFIKSVLITLVKYLLVLSLYFISGVSIVGIITVPFLMVWQGIIYGCYISYIYSIYGITGIAFNAILIIPSQVIFIIICIFFAQYSIEFSFNFVKLTLPKSRPTTLFLNFKKYSSKYLIYLLISLLCAIFDYFLYLMFYKMFNL